MNSVTWRMCSSLGTIAIVSLFLPACSSDGHFNLFGYTTAPNYDCTIKTVYVPMVKNLTMIHGSIEFDVTTALINEIQLKTPFRVVHSSVGADTELLCTIKNRNKVVININQLGENREAQLGLVFEVVWRDLRPGHDGEVLSGPKRKEGEVPLLDKDGKVKPPSPVVISPVTYYIPELGGSDATAKAEIYRKLAIQVTNMMEISGKWR
jgi:Lipopolysaccharide-assembly